MERTFRSKRWMIAAVTAAALLSSSGAFSQPADPAQVLRQRFADLGAALEASSIQNGLHVESVESTVTPTGDVYAVIDYPFATVANAFVTPAVLCESLILHINVQYCRAEGGDASPMLSVALGKKTNQELEDTHRIDLHFKAARDPEFLRVELTAKEGPLGTSNYLIAMELVALDDGRAFMHIRYAYRQGLLARIATSVYFSTRGRDKVGFTLLADTDGGKPRLVRGIRGVLERNTMRYYLAFDAYLHALDAPAPQRFEASIERWFAETERFARQLREVKRDDYLAMKRSQYERQRSAM